MKATCPVVWLLVGLLSAFNSGAVMAASSEDKPIVTAPTAKSQKPEAVKKTIPVKKPTSVKKRAPIASKSKPASEVVKTPLPPANLDLSLPQEMVSHLQPPGTLVQSNRASLLPKLLGEKPKESGPFQLNGRLINNEMGLQLRKEERRDVEGAALEFEFKQ
ncbi:translation initiation factor 2 [Pseudomonas sp. H11T01]|uniref:translation initiation factor 2 n=1 Tax=Pseudomonas sp. H11T01 TaxID=3402749 RepID=UPI003ACEBCB8